VSVFDDLHEDCAALLIQRLDTEVINDKDILLFNLGELLEIGAVCLSHFQTREELACVFVEDSVAQ